MTCQTLSLHCLGVRSPFSQEEDGETHLSGAQRAGERAELSGVKVADSGKRPETKGWCEQGGDEERLAVEKRWELSQGGERRLQVLPSSPAPSEALPEAPEEVHLPQDLGQGHPGRRTPGLGTHI